MDTKALEQITKLQRDEIKRQEKIMQAAIVMNREMNSGNLNDYYRDLYSRANDGSGPGEAVSEKMLLSIMDNKSIKDLERLYPESFKNVQDEINNKSQDTEFNLYNRRLLGLGEGDFYASSGLSPVLATLKVFKNEFPDSGQPSFDKILSNSRPAMDSIKNDDGSTHGKKDYLLSSFTHSIGSGNSPDNLANFEVRNSINNFTGNKSFMSFVDKALSGGVNFMRGVGEKVSDIKNSIGRIADRASEVYGGFSKDIASKIGTKLTVGVLAVTVLTGATSELSQLMSVEGLNTSTAMHQESGTVSNISEASMTQKAAVSANIDNILDSGIASSHVFGSSSGNSVAPSIVTVTASGPQVHLDGRYDDVHHMNPGAQDSYKDVAHEHFRNVLSSINKSGELGQEYYHQDFGADEMEDLMRDIITESAAATGVEVTNIMDPSIAYKFPTISIQQFMAKIYNEDNPTYESTSQAVESSSPTIESSQSADSKEVVQEMNTSEGIPSAGVSKGIMEGIARSEGELPSLEAKNQENKFGDQFSMKY